MSHPDPEHRSRLHTIAGSYWSSVHRVVRTVRRVPDWPAPVRYVVQALLAVVGVLLVLVIWISRTLVALLKVVGGLASRGGSPSGPPKYPTGNG
jgi:hypothetical protein